MDEISDAIDVLIEDHRSVDFLLEQLDVEDDSAKRRRLSMRIAGELAAHEAAENDVVFPAARATTPFGRRDVHELTGEHEEVNSLLAEMLVLDPSGAGFFMPAGALVLELRAHFAEEQEVLFPALRAALGAAVLAGLATRIRAAKRSAPMFPAA